MSGSLTVVGLGPAGPEHVTLEAAELLRAAASDGRQAYGFSNTQPIVEAIAPDLSLKLLDPLFSHGNLSHEQALRTVIEVLFRAAFQKQRDVLYLVVGNPLVINDVVWLIRARCRAEERTVRVVQGLSFLDLVLDQVHWTGDAGLQICSAWQVASGERTLAEGMPALLYELGEAGADQLPDMLSALQARLLSHRWLSAEVVILFSAGPPSFRSQSRRIALDTLAEQVIPPLANLWIPGQ